ncbi:olfactory receptor 52N4-like [Pleurodeles waltl]|uniref:olfactory receptor 52N4-like n=1 Tax=Pleurodeles waltl TaxID=8319 RepID=UPI0037098A85
MVGLNNATVSTSMFILRGFSGMEEYRIWISFPFCCIYIITVIANSSICFIIKQNASFHLPMYVLLSMLLVTGLVASNTILPKMLCLLLFNSKDISFEACLIQMFLVVAFCVMAFGVLVAMAFDRYTAICNPLRYTTILTNQFIIKIALTLISKGVLLALPLPFIFLRLPFCRSRTIEHTYCEHLTVAKLACADITINIVYGLAGSLLVAGFDFLAIVLSYIMIARAVFKLHFKESRKKAVSTCSTHLCFTVIAFVPIFLNVITNRFSTRVPAQVQILFSNLLVILPPLLNPIIFGINTKQIWEKIYQILNPTCLIGNIIPKHNR